MEDSVECHFFEIVFVIPITIKSIVLKHFSAKVVIGYQFIIITINH